MFNFFKKNNKNDGIYSPLDGNLVNLSQVPDKVFASKMMGDGFAIKPLEGEKVIEVCSPVNGTIVSLPETGHAVGIHTPEGADVLIHIGIDTVNLKGKGFKLLKKEGDKVSKKEALIDFDSEVVEEAKLDDTVMIIFTDGYNKKINLQNKYGDLVKTGEKVLE